MEVYVILMRSTGEGRIDKKIRMFSRKENRFQGNERKLERILTLRVRIHFDSRYTIPKFTVFPF